MKKKSFIAALLALIVMGCSTNRSGNENLIDNVIYDEAKSSYMFTATNTYPVEILINGYPVARTTASSPHNLTGIADIGIYKEGKQTLDVVIDLRQFKKEETYQPILSFVLYQAKSKESVPGPDNTINNFEISTNEITDDDVKDCIFTKTITFEAQPVVNIGAWQESKDMTEYDSDKLLKMAYLAYQDFKDVINNNKLAEFTEMVELAEYESGQLCNKRIDDIKNERNAWLSNSLNLQPMDNCEVKLYGDGKLLTLVVKSEQIIDISPLYTSPGDDDGDSHYVNLYYHFPSDSENLELIRFNTDSLKN